ncbi:MAG: nitroreductase family protein [Saprospiraceae bacterium]|nr:nitroreductase family protein [Saprospiraceae bacterium]
MESKQYPTIPYRMDFIDGTEMATRARAYYDRINARRSVRHFSDAPVDRNIIENLIRIASTAPSGANKQPWTFCAVSDPLIKSKIRAAAEEEEVKNYNGRMNEEWIADLAHLGTDHQKPNLEIAPWLIVVFKKPYDVVDGKRKKNYYVNESVGLACGFLLSAIHQVGLAALTHTPSPMNFLERVLDRPENERAYLLIPVGYPAVDAEVPDIQRKPLDQVSAFY